MNKKIAQNLINKTKQDYNKIADHFTSTRKKAVWPDVIESFNLMNLQKGKKILEVGSGSGRLYPVLNEFNLKYTGIDLSDELVKNAKKDFSRGNFLVGDAANLPFSDNEFDYTISVAVLYHIPSKELRNKSLKEIYRVTKPDGKVYISVWYFWNNRTEIKRIVAETLRIIIGKSDLDFGDFYRPWKTPEGKTETVRYCHAWTLLGLKKALKKAGFKRLQVVKNPESRTRNLNIICEK